jgi:hypothetical protein
MMRFLSQFVQSFFKTTGESSASRIERPVGRPDTEEVAMNWIVKVAKSLLQALTDPYRPELHYMRGPGPKWRTRHTAAC